MVDINWNGRSMLDDVKANTDGGKIDPSQGPQFYPAALRKHYKSDLAPDPHTIDPVPSPRNSNWWVLALAGTRAITFLERQPEVDPNRIGFTGFSMGGTITSMVAIDKRLKAVVPMVGGAGHVDVDFPGLPGTGRPRDRNHPELYNKTVDARSYWPHVTCPVLFLEFVERLPRAIRASTPVDGTTTAQELAGDAGASRKPFTGADAMAHAQ